MSWSLRLSVLKIDRERKKGISELAFSFRLIKLLAAISLIAPAACQINPDGG
jgi:hypothetical protein